MCRYMLSMGVVSVSHADRLGLRCSRQLELTAWPPITPREMQRFHGVRYRSDL